ncbi:minor tail protein [Microbacterium phage PauloDiaboli]|nr:minor tail protein [Microbacterium phage PauloDiaboli]
MAKQQPIAPVYRYYTADLLTNEILAEIPLRGVSYACALKAGGKFSGKIPVTSETSSMKLYGSTMPGNTALYVMRNGVCVWGGIIWARSYDLDSKDLQISASEFTSYFYHRKIWKTWNHQYGGTLAYTTNGRWDLSFDYGANILAKGGSTVQIEFYEPENFKYNGFYRVAETPIPTTDGFSLLSGFAVADIVSYENIGNTMTIYTKENHGYNNGDAVELTFTGDPNYPDFPMDGSITVTISDSGGPASNWFTVPTTGSLGRERTPAQGYASRPLPKGVYTNVTVTVRQDAYDYIRTLIDGMFNDFVGTDFPNVYIEPGISWGLSVITKQAIDGFAILQTAQPHGIAPGQAIQVQDVGGSFDGEFMVTDTPSPNVVVYESGGTSAYGPVGVLTSPVTNILMSNGVVTATTSNIAHGLTVGQNVTINIGDPYGDFSGTFKVTEIPGPTLFRYNTGLNRSYSSTALPTATASSTAFTTKEVKRAEAMGTFFELELEGAVPTTAVGQTVTIANTDRVLQITEKALDAPNAKATIKTAEDHGLRVGDTVVLSGLTDSAKVIAKSTTASTVTMTTERPHNFRAGDAIVIDGMDEFRVVSRSLSSNTATLTTAQNHTMSVGQSITVKDIYDTFTITQRGMVNDVAFITTSSSHNLSVNDPIVIEGLTDTYFIVSKEATNGVVTLTTSIPHNVLVGSKIKVSNVGMPFDSGEVVVDAVTATRLVYKIDEAYWKDQKEAAARKGQTLTVPTNVPAAKATGSVTNVSSFYNGQFVVSATPSTTRIEFALRGEDQPTVAASGTSPKVTAPSRVNGTYTILSRTDNTVTYSRSGSAMAAQAIPAPVNAEDPAALVTMNSVHRGAQTITSVTANTFTFKQTMPTATSVPVTLDARKGSIFNGTRTITEVPTTDRFSFSLPGYAGNIFEESQTNPSFARATSLYNGTYTITSVNTQRKTIRMNKTLSVYGSKPVLSRGSSTVTPSIIISSFGPFPGNADLGMEFSSRGYTGINLEPTMYRGFELKSVGEALDEYSDNINGFEYRIDVEYDKITNTFTKKFVLIPINFPNEPPPGSVAPLTRYGADKLIFEYPGGNISSVQIDESAEESATRFFAVGETDLGPEAGPNIGVASADDLLQGKDGRKWPLLDASESVSGVDNKDELHAYAKRYLSEASPPYTTLSVSLNGSIAPFVGSYKPGDWCALILDDPFMAMRLGSEMEPRSDVFVRKISSFTVTVPDGVTFPETVALNLVAEWEVDKRGK